MLLVCCGVMYVMYVLWCVVWCGGGGGGGGGVCVCVCERERERERDSLQEGRKYI